MVAEAKRVGDTADEVLAKVVRRELVPAPESGTFLASNIVLAQIVSKLLDVSEEDFASELDFAVDDYIEAKRVVEKPKRTVTPSKSWLAADSRYVHVLGEEGARRFLQAFMQLRALSAGLNLRKPSEKKDEDDAPYSLSRVTDLMHGTAPLVLREAIFAAFRGVVAREAIGIAMKRGARLDAWRSHALTTAFLDGVEAPIVAAEKLHNEAPVDLPSDLREEWAQRARESGPFSLFDDGAGTGKK